MGNDLCAETSCALKINCIFRRATRAGYLHKLIVAFDRSMRVIYPAWFWKLFGPLIGCGVDL